MPFALLAAPSGTGLESSKNEIIQSLGGETEVEWVDLEEELCKLPGVAGTVQSAETSVYPGRAGTGPMTIGRVTFVSRQQVALWWAAAATESKRKLDDSPKKYKLLVVNLTYFNACRREFYFPFRDVDVFDGFRPSQVILLFDDIYDTFIRLSGFGGEESDIFEAKRGIAELGFQRKEKVDLTREWNRFKIVLEWTVQLCSLILEWRKEETLFAENLALRWNARFLPLAIKQPAVVIARWLANPNALSVYLSHNITGFRNEHTDGQAWADAVLQINRIPTEGNDNLVVLMPTGIDELRIKQDNDGLLTTRLKDRWPLMSDVLYERPIQAAADYVDFFCLPTPSNDDLINWVTKEGRWEPYSGPIVEPEFVNGVLQALLNRIQEQIALRDHLLVAHCDTLCVYRPYKEAAVSGGVQAEIQHWIVKSAQSASQGVTLAFVHSLDDIRNLLNSQTIREAARQLRDRTIVRPRPPLQWILPRLEISSEEREKFLMRQIEPLVPEEHPRVASWVFENEELTTTALPADVRQTLSARHGQPVRNWLGRAQSLFEQALNA